MLARFNRQKGVNCTMTENTNGSILVKITATATKIVAELRRPLEELMKGRAISHASLTPDVLQLLFNRDGILLMRSFEREMGVYILFDRRRLNVRIFARSEKALSAEERFVESLLNLHERQHEIDLRGAGLPNDLMKEVVRRFGHDLHTLKNSVPDAELTLNIRRHVISICGSKDAKQKVEEIINEIAQASGQCCLEPNNAAGETCPICFCEVEDKYQLESCNHVFCRSCLVNQCESSIRNKDGFPIRCFHEGCNVPIWLVDLKLLLTINKLDELFESSMVAFVTSSCGAYRFCPSPDCPSVYKVADPDTAMDPQPFLCRACYAETCTSCHLEHHPNISCEKYKEYKEDPDASLKEWSKGKDEYVKKCPGCGYTIEKAEGCNHVECKCGRHLCWVCLEHFFSTKDCYSHLQSVHQGIS
ncbi:hypothetical protein RND81_05G159100 [Saponaria officinalis]|uniref:Uncharacterized protein n=1 Tax=Saponaria officinalis TaxID=3572 RepID=A0AAW1KTJ0_SAPOF